MFWLLGKMQYKWGSPEHRKMVLASCAIARLTLMHVRVGETRSLIAIEKAEAWAKDEGTALEEVKAAVSEAFNAAYLAENVAGYAAVTASRAAAYAANCAVLAAAHAAGHAAANVAAHAAGHASQTVVYASRAANTAQIIAGAEAASDIPKKCAEIVRVYFSEAPEVATSMG